MPSVYIWDNLPGIELFDILKLPNIHTVYSCFNYNPGPGSKSLDLYNAKHAKRIYYTGERFLYDTNADIIIGFMPSIELIKQMAHTLYQKIGKRANIFTNTIMSYPVEIINVELGYTNNALAKLTVNDIINTSKQFILLRDQERSMLEYMYKKGTWDPVNLAKNNITIYADLELSWSRVQIGMKTRFCCFIVSNPGCWQRNNFFEMLCKYKQVDSLGRYKRRLPVDIVTVPERGDQDAYFGLLAQYKFMITFENNSLIWYNTEKIFNAFQAGVVPIYWGDPLIDVVYNPECFVWVKTESTMVAQYNEFNRAINYIKTLDNDDELYLSLFKMPKTLMVNSQMEDKRLNDTIKEIIALASSHS